jgi:hypothetical protein
LVFFGQHAYIFSVRFNNFRAVKIPEKRVFDPWHGSGRSHGAQTRFEYAQFT